MKEIIQRIVKNNKLNKRSQKDLQKITKKKNNRKIYQSSQKKNS
jgi:hypothetical protein